MVEKVPPSTDPEYQQLTETSPGLTDQAKGASDTCIGTAPSRVRANRVLLWWLLSKWTMNIATEDAEDPPRAQEQHRRLSWMALEDGSAKGVHSSCILLCDSCCMMFYLLDTPATLWYIVMGVRDDVWCPPREADKAGRDVVLDSVSGHVYTGRITR